MMFGQNFNKLISLDTASISNENPFINPSEFFEANHEADISIKDKRDKFFRMETIPIPNYKQLKSKSKSTLNTDSTKVIWTDSSFVIKLKHSTKEFICNKRDYSKCNYYLGYLSPLQLYAISYVDGHNEVGMLVMLDKVSGKTFCLNSQSDSPLESPTVSRDTSILSAYVNNVYTDEGYISLYKIEIKGAKYQLKPHAGLVFNKSIIEDLIWINKSQFIVLIKEVKEHGDSDLNYCLRITIKNNFR
jgi:hypothetical protein